MRKRYYFCPNLIQKICWVIFFFISRVRKCLNILFDCLLACLSGVPLSIKIGCCHEIFDCCFDEENLMSVFFDYVTAIDLSKYQTFRPHLLLAAKRKTVLSGNHSTHGSFLFYFYILWNTWIRERYNCIIVSCISISMCIYGRLSIVNPVPCISFWINIHPCLPPDRVGHKVFFVTRIRWGEGRARAECWS